MYTYTRKCHRSTSRNTGSDPYSKIRVSDSLDSICNLQNKGFRFQRKQNNRNRKWIEIEIAVKRKWRAKRTWELKIENGVCGERCSFNLNRIQGGKRKFLLYCNFVERVFIYFFPFQNWKFNGSKWTFQNFEFPAA